MVQGYFERETSTTMTAAATTTTNNTKLQKTITQAIDRVAFTSYIYSKLSSFNFREFRIRDFNIASQRKRGSV